MGTKTFKNIILEKKFLRFSFWKKILKRNFFAVKNRIKEFKPKVTPFPFKKWENIDAKNFVPPETTGWERRWYGYWEMEKTLSPEFRKFCEEISKVEKGLTEEEFESQCFLSIINEIKDEQIKIFELGAGAGRISLELAGIVDFRLVPNAENKTYRCLAVEAEPTHFEWIVEHFKKQNINGEVLRGVVSDRKGFVNFDTSLDPASFYGQSITYGSGDRVKSFTVDELIKKYNFDKVNIAHTDVQGNEFNVIKGAENSIRDGLVDYWLIGIHEEYLAEEIVIFTKKFYDVILHIPQKSGLTKHDFYGWVSIPSDGLLILRHKKVNK